MSSTVTTELSALPFNRLDDLDASGRMYRWSELMVNCLLVDDRPDDVADGDDPDRAPFHDRQMSDAFFGHQRHALIRRPVRLDRDNSSRHDLADERLLGRFAKKDHLPRVVALREDAVDLLIRPTRTAPMFLSAIRRSAS